MTTETERPAQHPRQPAHSRLLALAGAAAWAALLVYVLLHRSSLTLETVLNYTPSNPVLAAAALMGMFLLKSTTFFFYAGILYAASGILFPLPVAILLNVCGTCVMVLLPYTLSRRVGAGYADALMEKHPRLHVLDRLRSGSDLALATLLRSVKAVNFDLGSLYMGAIRLRPSAALLGSVLGKASEIVLFPIIGAHLNDPHASAFWISIAADGLITVATLLIARRIASKKGADTNRT